MTDVFTILDKTLKEKIQDRRAAVGDGGAKDYAEYRQVCGEILGLSIALREIQDLAKQCNEYDNDD